VVGRWVGGDAVMTFLWFFVANFVDSVLEKIGGMRFTNREIWEAFARCSGEVKSILGFCGTTYLEG